MDINTYLKLENVHWSGYDTVKNTLVSKIANNLHNKSKQANKSSSYFPSSQSRSSIELML